MQLSPARQGFDLPANPDPKDYLCVTVYIPNDPAHVKAFLGVMYDLTIWLSWQSDSAHTAIKAAQVWKRLYIKLQDEIGKCKTSGDYVQVMEDFMSVCQQLRIHDGKLQGLCCFDPTTGEATWEDIQGQEGGFLPAGATQPGATPRPTPAASKCYTVLLNANSEWILPFAVTDGDQITISNADGIWSDGSVGWYCPDGTPYALGFCVGLPGHVSGDPDTTDWHMQAIAQVGSLFYPASGGTFTIPGGTGSQQLVLKANDASPSDNRGSISLKICVESGSTPPVSTWCYVFDFTLSDYGTLWGLQSGEGGVYVPGVGWQSTAIGGHNQIILLADLPTADSYTEYTAFLDADGSGNYNLYEEGSTIDSGTLSAGSVSVTYSADITQPGQLKVEPYGPNNYTITRIQLKGTGANPFGGDNC